MPTGPFPRFSTSLGEIRPADAIRLIHGVTECTANGTKPAGLKITAPGLADTVVLPAFQNANRGDTTSSKSEQFR
eukprot:COSAG02_NODE_48674_length_332_cov_0.665236_1_plen_74_part_10